MCITFKLLLSYIFECVNGTIVVIIKIMSNHINHVNYVLGVFPLSLGFGLIIGLALSFISYVIAIWSDG